MIIPMMMKVDFTAIRAVGRRPKGVLITLFVNWMVKPFSMAVISWLFFRHVFSAWISPAEASQYIAGTIILGRRSLHCHGFCVELSDGRRPGVHAGAGFTERSDHAVALRADCALPGAAARLRFPYLSVVLFLSVVAFIVIPLAVGTALRAAFIRRHGKEWFETALLPKFSPVTIMALLATLVLIFAFQSENLTGKSLHVLLIAVPILIQVYFNSALAYFLMHLFRVEYRVAAPGALIGASNFFELAVATSIALFGAGSGRGSRHGRRRIDRSAGDALGLRHVQSHAPLVLG